MHLSFPLSPYEILGNLFQQEKSDVCLEIQMQFDPEELNMTEVLHQRLRLGYGRTSSWVLDALLPYERTPSSQNSASFDNYGRSNYGRAVEAIIYSVHSDIASIKESPSLLVHITLASRLAADALDGMGSYGIYSDTISRYYLKSICRESEQVISYAISSLAADLPISWHQSAMTSMTKGNALSDTLSGLLYDLATQHDGHEAYMRSLRDIIERVLRSTDTVIAERWLAFASGLNSKRKLTLVHYFEYAYLIYICPLFQLKPLWPSSQQSTRIWKNRRDWIDFGTSWLVNLLVSSFQMYQRKAYGFCGC